MFFLDFLGIIYSSEFKNIIEEVRIEGHTSTIGARNKKQDPYFYNMKLSQNRSRSCFGSIVMTIMQITIKNYG